MESVASPDVIVECVIDARHPFLALRAGEMPDFEGAAVLLADAQFQEICDLLALLARLDAGTPHLTTVNEILTLMDRAA